MWALGDYHRFAKQTVWGLGPELVAACGISPGQRVLDVAAGTGNVAIRAAEAGARGGRRPTSRPRTSRPAVARPAREASSSSGSRRDAEALPFADGEFDVVTSSVGAMFAPDHQAVADELLRVCRPGGTIGMINFLPAGVALQFFETLGRHMPAPPPNALPPVLWGSEEHVRELFGDRVSSLALTPKSYVEQSPGGPAEYVAFFKETFGPVIALYALLADEPERLAALDRDFRDFADRANSGTPDGRPSTATSTCWWWRRSTRRLASSWVTGPIRSTRSRRRRSRTSCSSRTTPCVFSRPASHRGTRRRSTRIVGRACSTSSRSTTSCAATTAGRSSSTRGTPARCHNRERRSGALRCLPIRSRTSAQPRST